MSDLRPILEAVEPLRERHDVLLAAGVTAESAAAATADLPLGELTPILASMFWAAASDNLLAWHHLAVRARVQPMAAHGSLARATIEGAVVTRWLVEPGIAPAIHRNRGAIAQLADFRYRLGFEQGIGRPQDRLRGDGQPAAVREREHLAEMRRHGIPARGEPGMTDLYGLYAIPGRRDGAWLYRLVSGFAHGRPWAIGTGRLARVAGPASPRGGAIVSATASAEGAELLARASVRVLTTALDELAEFEGHR